MEPPEVLRRGAEAFNRGDFFEAHEIWEDAWAEESGQVRLFYQGIIQVAVGCCHVQRGNRTGAIHLMGRGVDKLAEVPDAYLGMDLGGFRTASAAALARIRDLDDDAMAAFPASAYPLVRWSA